MMYVATMVELRRHMFECIISILAAAASENFPPGLSFCAGTARRRARVHAAAGPPPKRKCSAECVRDAPEGREAALCYHRAT